jgi:branched-chain amino acid transport system permease protein
VIAGFLIGIIEVLSVVFGGSPLKDAFVFAALFLVLVLRPEGIFGQRLGRVG